MRSAFPPLAAGIVLALIPAGAYGQCSNPTLLVPDGLRKGQSISILPFRLLNPPREPTPQRAWYEEEERKLQRSFSASLQEALGALGLFRDIQRLPERAATDLSITGEITGIRDTANGVSVQMSVLVARPSGGSVLRIAECATAIRTNAGRSFVLGTPAMLESFLSNIAKDIASAIAAAAGPSAPAGLSVPAGLPAVAGPAPAAPDLETRLAAVRNAPDKRARANAIEDLGEIATTDSKASASVIAVLSNVIRSTDTRPALGRIDIQDHEAAMKILVKMQDPRAVEPLLAGLQHQDEYVRIAAAEALGAVRDPRVTERLAAALKDPDHRVRESAANSLGKGGDPRAVEPLIAALKDPELESNAIRALAAIGDSRAVEPVVGTFSDRRVWVREAAVIALGTFKDPRAVESLIVALRDPINTVAIRAAESLGIIGDARAVPPLLHTLKSTRDVWTRNGAAKALQAMSGQDFGTDAERWKTWFEQNRLKP